MYACVYADVRPNVLTSLGHTHTHVCLVFKIMATIGSGLDVQKLVSSSTHVAMASDIDDSSTSVFVLSTRGTLIAYTKPHERAAGAPKQ